MEYQFINPNWHVILIHLPLGVLITGVIVELLSLMYRKSWFQNAARLMILVGGLGSIITLASGVYAFRNVASELPTIPQISWQSIVENSSWTAVQWDLMEDHLSLGITGVICFIVVILLWLASNETWRRKLYWPLLIILLIGTACIIVGARDGGEAVYRFGTGVDPAILHQRGNANIIQQAEQTYTIKFFVPPLQLHVVLAGVVLASMVLTVAFSIKTFISSGKTQMGYDTIPYRLNFFWISTLVITLATAIAGLWSAQGGFGLSAFKSNLETLSSPEHRRLLIHLASGLIFVFFTVITIYYIKKRRRFAYVFIICNLIIAAVIIWFGVLMLYDSYKGPLFKFTTVSHTRQIQASSFAKPAVKPSLYQLGQYHITHQYYG